MTVLLNLFEQAGRYVTTWSWQLVILVGVIWIAIHCDRRHRSQFRYSLSSLALAASLMLPWAPQKISSLSWMVHAKEVWTDPSGTGTTIARTNAAPVAQQATSNETDDAGPVQPEPALTESRVTSAIPLRIIGLLWFLGILAAGTRKIRQHWKLSGIVSRAEVVSASQVASGYSDTSLPILLSREVSGPMLYGWIRPVILLPGNILEWSTVEARHPAP